MVNTLTSSEGDLRHSESYKTLTVHERQAADRLLHLLVQFAEDLSAKSNLMPTKLLTRMVIKRLIQKLQEKHLPDAAVKDIASGVWTELNGISRLEERQEATSVGINTAEQQIVCDIMKRLNGRSTIISALWDRLLISAGTDVNARIIAVVAEEAWPFVKSKLG